MYKYLSKVWYILEGHRKRLPLLITLFILSSVLEALGIGLIGPFLHLAEKPDLINEISFLRWTYIQLNFKSSSQFIPVLGLTIAVLFCIKSVLYFLARLYILKFSFNLQAKLASRLLNTYLSVPYTFYLRKNTSSIIKNITYETSRINHFCMQPLLNAIANLTVVFVLLVLLAQTDSFLLVLILTIILPIFLLFYKLKNRFKEWGKQSSESNKGMIKVVNHGLGGFKETRIIGCEAHFQYQMEEQARKFAVSSTRTNSFNFLPRIVIETCLIVFVLLFVSISQLFFEQSVQDIISVMAVFAVASIRLIPAASQSIQAMGQLSNATYSIDSIYLDFKELEKEELNPIANNHLENSLSKYQASKISISINKSIHNNMNTMSFENQVELRGIDYYYPGSSETALDSISFKITKGESIALIGKSGAGKTTLVDVLLGLLRPQKGDIKVDNTSIYKDIRAWQNLLGYIPQSIFLMDDTIERNIAFGIPDNMIDLERLNEAIQAAQLEGVVKELPNGRKTVVGERGVRLSGGQRQRIGIARALYHEREILVLDEATSALDNETEKLVSQAISSLAGRKTLIIIAHRLSTVENCDRVYMLNKGRIVSSGSYEDVIVK